MKLLVIGSKARVEKYLPDLPITREVETVVVERGASDDEILNAASDADFIMADAISPVSARLIESMPNLKLIHSEGVAYNAIDLDAARARSVLVCNNAGANAVGVAEQTILLMLACLRDAVNATISYTNEAGKIYQLKPNPAVLICRVRGLHLPEKHVTWRGEAIPGSLFDFALYFFHNYQALLAKGSGPYFYLPKTQSWQEAAWWSEVFSYAEDRFNLPRGTIKATLLIETLPAVFQMDEILHALRDHIVGLNCGRWDYIFSYIKTLKNYPDRVLPDRQAVTMDKPFLNAYSRLLIKTCHKRGAFAMGGMAAFIPSKDEERNNQVLNKVKADKSLEANNGHDGTWIAHPGLADTAMAVFNDILGSRKNQLEVMREQDAPITADQLLAPCDGERTEEGMRANIRVAVQYIEAWISGNGCVPIYGLMEDAATAEISRTSIWQWIHHQKTLSNGKPVTKALFRQMLGEEMKVIASELGEERFSQGRFDDAARLMEQITTSDELIDFLTLPGYRLLA